MTTYCWDGRTLSTDCPDGVEILIDGKSLHLQPGTVAAFGEHAAAALGALSCGATSARALETGPKVAEALRPVGVNEDTTIELQEVQDDHTQSEAQSGAAGATPETDHVTTADAAEGRAGKGAGLGRSGGTDKGQGRRRRTPPQD